MIYIDSPFIEALNWYLILCSW